MEIRLFGSSKLPAACRRPSSFRRACRAALGPAARRRGELNLVFADRAEMRRINKTYLAHDYDTDVIAFPYPPVRATAAGEPPPFGDVYVSLHQARRQARELRHELLEELLTLAVHGTLHLVGYRDGKPAERRRMFARQDRLLRSLRTAAR